MKDNQKSDFSKRMGAFIESLVEQTSDQYEILELVYSTISDFVNSLTAEDVGKLYPLFSQMLDILGSEEYEEKEKLRICFFGIVNDYVAVLKSSFFEGITTESEIEARVGDIIDSKLAREDFFHDTIAELDKFNRKSALVTYVKENAIPNITRADLSTISIKSDIKRNQVEMSIDDKGNITINEIPNTERNIFHYDEILMDTLMAAFEAAYKKGYGDKIYLKRTNLANSLGIEIPAPKSEDLNDIIDYINNNRHLPDRKEREKELGAHFSFWINFLSLEMEVKKFVDLPEEGGTFKVFSFEGYDKDKDMIVCSSPYFHGLFNYIQNHPYKASEKMVNDKAIYRIPGVTHTFKVSANKIKNRKAWEIVKFVDRKIAEHGTEPEAKRCGNKHKKYSDERIVKGFIPYREIIESCESIKNSYDTAKAPNKIIYLKRAFFGTSAKGTPGADPKKYTDTVIEKIFKQHTYLYDSLVNFNLWLDPISLKTLDSCGIHYQHYGRNGNFDQKAELLRPKVEKYS